MEYLASLSALILFLIFILGILALMGYFIPTIIALVRGHKNSLLIFILNLFLGTTCVAWVIALIWALSDFEINKKDDSAEKIKDLAQLHKEGKISDEEFIKQKNEILG